MKFTREFFQLNLYALVKLIFNGCLLNMGVIPSHGMKVLQNSNAAPKFYSKLYIFGMGL